MRVAIVFVLIPIILLIGFGIPLVIGVYVYRDANRRGMNAALWTLVAILAPSLIGFIIYLLVRNNNSDMLCPRCDTPIREDYVICPNCGAKLQPYCSNCATPLQPDWKVCPRCAQPVTEIYDDVVGTKYHEDNSLWKMLIAILAIPVSLIIILLLGVSAFKVSSSGGYSSAMTEVSLGELAQQAQNGSTFKHWMNTLEPEYDSAYVLEYVEETYHNTYRYYYVLYVPAAGAGAEVGFGVAGGLFKDVMRVELQRDEDMSGNLGLSDDSLTSKSVYCIEADVDSKTKLEVYCNGQKLGCEITSVDFNPTGDLFEEDFDVMLETEHNTQVQIKGEELEIEE